MNGDTLFNIKTTYKLHPKDYDSLKLYFEKKQGWVYVATSSHTHMLKIGRTSKDPLERAKSLSSSGVPYDYDILFSLKFLNQYIAEKSVHLYLDKCRGPKEFFNTNVETVALAIQKEYQRQQVLLERFFDTKMLEQDIELLEHSIKI